MFSSILDMLYTLFFISNTRLKLAKKNQTKAKQHPEAELCLLKIICFLLISKKHRACSKNNCKKNKCVYFNEIIWLIIIIKVKKKSRSHRYVINSLRLDMVSHKLNIKIGCTMTLKQAIKLLHALGWAINKATCR